ncbi:MAG: hypothetical protein M1818_004625 [Claussenomyces sp. TS43310]|nr:MAG: hypothetical protein M1818_004625 [Claussenomyces sp. TS43310]
MLLATSGLLVAGLINTALSQYFLLALEGITTLLSKYHEGVEISYKEPRICETTPGVKSYSGYFHLPPGLLSDIAGEQQDYPMNTSFWCSESRKDPHNAPLSIWLNGGPGGSSLMGLLQELGPCFVNSDSNSTYLNPWSWNNEVNMLFLDQPEHVGFSYDTLSNGTWGFQAEDVGASNIILGNFSNGVPEQNATHLVGTFSSQNVNTFSFEFPAYTTNNNRISLWYESYGGHYGPAFFNFFRQQNQKIANGSISEPGTKYIHLDTLGIINGLVDMLKQFTSWPNMAYNNTYGIEAINKTIYDEMMYTINERGCLERLEKCQKAIEKHDPGSGRNIDDIEEFCGPDKYCNYNDSVGSYQNFSKAYNHAFYNIARSRADNFPHPILTAILASTGKAFEATYDIVHGGYLQEISELLESGVKVAFVYGDRDFACNLMGGETISLAINYTGTKQFHAAGYTPILSPGVGIGGQVRQYGNLSFSRVYQAGHQLPSYQPEMACSIFRRSIFNKDIATSVVPWVHPRRGISRMLYHRHPNPYAMSFTHRLALRSNGKRSRMEKQ